MSAQSAQKLLQWVMVYRPDLYVRLPENITSPTPSAQSMLAGWEDIISTIATAAVQYDNNKTTRKQIDINIARAQAGQDPLIFAANGQPLPTSQSVSVNAKANTNVLIFGGLAALGLIFLMVHMSGNKSRR